MTSLLHREPMRSHTQRRNFLNRSVAARTVAALLATTMITGSTASFAASVDLTKWSPEYVRSIAGTAEVDTAAECAKVVPQDYKGRLTYWWVGPTQAQPEIDHKINAEFWEAWKKAYPNIETDAQSLDYNDMLNKVRTAALGNAAPMVAKFPILWGVEFAAKGQLKELKPEDVGYEASDFWAGAMKSVTYDGKTYGIPTNNETMGFIWNAKIFADAGLDPEKPPATWDDVVTYSKQIKDKLGINGYGLVARQNAGNTPFRFMPQLWSYGGGALDETSDSPTYKTVELNNAGSKAALQAAYDMYVRDRSVPASALTNTQNENQNPFIAGQLGMMIAHPAEYAKMVDLASKATGADKEKAEAVVANMRYGLLPQGPARRAVVFGGSNVHVFSPNLVEGGLDMEAARAFICFSTGPEWSTKLAWVGSNPGHLDGFTTKWMKERLDTIKFLDVTTSMLPSGIPFPVIPEQAEIMNIIVPDMMQNALTGKMTVDQAADDAARKVQDLLDGM